MTFTGPGVYDEIPKRGTLAALTVPGIVSAWDELHKEYSTMELEELLKPAKEYAESGFPVTQNYVESIRAVQPLMAECGGGWSELFLSRGMPVAGSNLRQRDLAMTLGSIAKEGAATFYKGPLMEKIVSGVKLSGGILEEEDFEKHSSTWDEPLSSNYRGVDIYETSPNSQGATALLWLNMLEKFSLRQREPDELLEMYLKTGLKAYQERSKFIADPLFHKLPSEFTSKEFAEQTLNSERPHSMGASRRSSDGDTTYFAITDAEGNCASVIQSNYMGFGSGLVPRGTGFVMQNRGCYFTLDPRHHNCLVPGKRTFHTLCASMGVKDGRTLFALGLMGGDIQPQVHVQLITKILDLGRDIQSAIDEPRWAFPGTIYEIPSTLLIEDELASQLQGFSFEGLQSEIVKEYSSKLGHAQGVFINDEGTMSGGADPRGDGAAVGF